MSNFLALAAATILGALIFKGIDLYMKKRNASDYTHKKSVETEPLAELTEDEAKAIDPDNPPYYANYRKIDYDPEKAPRCSCHSRKIKAGERILLWPIPEEPSGGVDIFCMDTAYKAYQR